MFGHSLRACFLLLSFLVILLSSSAQAEQSPSQPQSNVDTRADGVDDNSAISTRARHAPKFFKYVTRPDIGAPRWDVTVYDKDAVSPGYWFVAPYAHLKQEDYKTWNGPHIYDGNGELIWSGAPMFQHYNTYDFRTVEVDGKQMASLIFRKDEDGVIFDNTYQVYKDVNMRGYLPQWLIDFLGDERKTNMHDFNVVDNGARAVMLTKVFENATIEESRRIGFEGNCTAKWQGFREVDVATSKPLFEWSAHGHIDLEESTYRGKSLDKMCNGNLGRGGWDILHLNSIDKFPDGDYLVSSRHTDTLYKVSHLNGSILWRLGGIRSDFEFSGEAKFSRQHHARVHDQNETHTLITVFDNARGDGPHENPSHEQSRGLFLSLRTDVSPMTAELIGAYNHPKGRYTPARGSMQILPNDNAFVCWSGGTEQSEHTPDGRLVMESKFKLGGANSYRSYKFDWVGKPVQPPDVHSAAVQAGKHGTNTIVHVSWNGATEVKSWNLYKTNSNGGAKELIASTLRQGFESSMTFEGYASFVVVEAVDINEKVLGQSLIVKTIEPIDPMSPAVVEESKWLQDHFSDTSDIGSNLVDSDATSATSMSFLESPAFSFILGLVSCVVTILVARYLWTSRQLHRLWERRKTQTYKSVSAGDEEKGEPEEETLVGEDMFDSEKERVTSREEPRSSEESR